jgi:hypothetical protein
MESELRYFAQQDLDTARREGEILVAQTKRGTLMVRYAEKTYSITVAGGEQLMSGTRKQAIQTLSSLYTVQSV